ncbi:aldo/keto reductase [Xylaria sp. FL0064]|nr:aldo/keto reductase [Xylaria sp. FL0064]
MASKSTPLRQLGKNGPMVPALGFGLMGLSHNIYGELASDEERFAILDRAHELGLRFWDSADLYGDSEELLGKWFRRTGKRNDIFLATKFGFVKGDRTHAVDTSYAYTKKACAESLRILGIDCIDLYYMHNANPDTPIEETIRALKELQEEGKIKYIGLSAISSTTLRRAVKIAPVTAIQTEYSVTTRDIEGPSGTNLLATARELGVGITVAGPLGHGLLTDPFSKGEVKFDAQDVRPAVQPRFQEANRAQNVSVAAQFRALAEKKHCSVSQLAIAWLLKQGDDIIPTPGTKKMKYLEENWGALELKLSDQEEAEIREFSDKNKLAGAIAPERFLPYIFRDTKEES